MTTARRGDYDAVPYRGVVAPAADVRRLESFVALFGMAPTPPASARVLELGCGTGANLLPLAFACPGATLVGCDLAGTAIASARSMAAALGVANLDLRHANLADVDDGWGEFDYIVCHDVFSWVTSSLRRRILEILGRNLAPHGVAYVSYDALPGWHLHAVARDMMRYHTRHVAGPRQTIDQARTMLSMAARVQDQGTSGYASLIRDEYCLMSAVADDQLYHVIAEEHHRPFYFHEFLEEVGAANLQWLGDAVPEVSAPSLPEAAQTFLDQLPFLERQQHRDFLTNCAFRRALLCRPELSLRRSPDEQIFRKLWIGLTRAARLEQAAESAELGMGTNGGRLRTTDPAIREALDSLDRSRPDLVPFTTLFGSADNGAVEFMMRAFDIGAIDCVLTPFAVTTTIGSHPIVSPLARLQAEAGDVVTNQKSEPVPLNDLMRRVAPLLDGTRDRAALAAEITGAAEASDVTDDCLRYARNQALLLGQRIDDSQIDISNRPPRP